MWSINDNKMHMYNIVFHSPSESNRLPYYPQTIFARCKKESVFHEIRETCHFITFLFPEKKKSFSDTCRKCILPNKIKAQNNVYLVKCISC